jgi:hypothetical protein
MEGVQEAIPLSSFVDIIPAGGRSHMLAPRESRNAFVSAEVSDCCMVTRFKPAGMMVSLQSAKAPTRISPSWPAIFLSALRLPGAVQYATNRVLTDRGITQAIM